MRILKGFTVLVLLLTAAPAWAITLRWKDASHNEDGFTVEKKDPGAFSCLCAIASARVYH
jgi:hypothetical protein